MPAANYRDTHGVGQPVSRLPYDIVLADYRLPASTGVENLFGNASERARSARIRLVTGTLGEEMAVECIKRGITPFCPEGPSVAASPGGNARPGRKNRSAMRARLLVWRRSARANPIPCFYFQTTRFPCGSSRVRGLQFLQVNDAAVGHYGYRQLEFLQMRASELHPAEEFRDCMPRSRADLPGHCWPAIGITFCESVLFVTDDIHSGASLIKMTELVEKAGGKIVPLIMTMGNFSGASVIADKEIYALFTHQVESWKANDCPLCKRKFYGNSGAAKLAAIKGKQRSCMNFPTPQWFFRRSRHTHAADDFDQAQAFAVGRRAHDAGSRFGQIGDGWHQARRGQCFLSGGTDRGTPAIASGY